jgi:predicted Rossmann fold nucleotide-binding protein DprA/Smf involved in DNA uptake
VALVGPAFIRNPETRVDNRELQALLAWSALPGVGERTLLALQDQAHTGRLTLAELWTSPLEDLSRLVRLHPRAVEALRTQAADRWSRAAEERDEIRARGVEVLVEADPEYPAPLAAAAHAGRRRAAVFAYGALPLLEEGRVALVNSRSPDNAALAATDALADALARRDVPLVTSTSREAYQAAATAAKRHAGPAILALDRGLAEVCRHGLEREPVAPARVWDAAFDPDVQLLLSPFSWREPGTARNGAVRDALVFDLADVVVALDVTPDGNMMREARRALKQGRPVLALDRGVETREGARALWEQHGAIRLPWEGAEMAAEAVIARLPRRNEPGEARPEEGWRREIAGFMARACAQVVGHRPSSPQAVGAFPPSGVFAEAAARWSPSRGDSSTGLHWLLADLHSDRRQTPARVAQLLERVARGGVLAAVLPAAWLEAQEHARARAAWLESGALRLVVELPQPPRHSGATERAAVLLLEREGTSRGEAPVLRPHEPTMGRFLLRRYLAEALTTLPR